MSISRGTPQTGTPNTDPTELEAQAAENIDTEDFGVDALEELLQDGKRRFNEGDVNGAADCFRQLLAIESTNKAAWNNLGVAMHVQRKWNEAIEAFSHALALDVADRNIRHNIRTLLMDVDRDGRMDADTLVKYGEALHRVGHLADAYEQFALAVQSNPEHSEAWNNLGVTMLQIGQMEEAENALRRAIELNENDLNARNNLATLLVAAERKEEGKVAFHQILEIDPMDEMARQRILEFELEDEASLNHRIALNRARIALDLLATVPADIQRELGWTLQPV